MRKKSGAAVAVLAVTLGLAGATPAHAEGVWSKPSPKPYATVIGETVPVPKPPKPNPRRDHEVKIKDLSNAVDARGERIRPPTIVDGYAYGGKYRNGTGVVAVSSSVRIARPLLDPIDHHTLAEKAVQKGRNTLEVGWAVDNQNVFGQGTSQHPYLFVSAWYDNGTSSVWCGSYLGGCGYTDYGSNSTNAGADLDSVRDTEKQIQVVYSAGNWWIWYDTNWLGYFPAALGHGVSGFTSGDVIQDFGEISYGHYGTCTDMGNGYLGNPTNTYPTSGASFKSLNVSTGSGYSLAAYSGQTVTEWQKWNVADDGSYSFYYGGPATPLASVPKKPGTAVDKLTEEE